MGQSQTNSEQQERNKQQGQNRPRVKMDFCYLPPERVKMGFCCLPPDRVKLTVNSRKETNSRVKWAKSQNGPRVKMGFCSLPPDRVKLAVNSRKETNSRVKMGQESRSASVIYPLKKSKWDKGHYELLLFTP